MDNLAPTLIFLVSSHGYGHYMRARHVLMALDRLRSAYPPFQVHIFGRIPETFYTCLDPEHNHLHQQTTDVGLVQTDFRTIDVTATIDTLSQFYNQRENLLTEITKTLHGLNCFAVCGDITPLAPLLGERLKIPAAIQANFTWCDIYEDLIAVHPDFALATKRWSAMYQRATACFQIPPHCALSPFTENFITQVPLVTDSPRSESRDEVISWIQDYPAGETPPMVLLSFGGYEAGDIPLAPMKQMAQECRFLTNRKELASPAQNLYFVDSPSTKYAAVVQHVDLVFSKPGYGIICDCLIGQTPLLYTDRGRFAEYPFLVEWLNKNFPCHYIPGSDFLSGNWETHVKKALALPRQFADIPVNGADVIAKALLKYLK